MNMRTPCHYSIVRFLPFVETGEFANVGVVLFAPESRYFGYKLLRSRHARVTNFFEQLDARVFKAVMRAAAEELKDVSLQFRELGTDKRLRALDRPAAFQLWEELTKPLATALRFGERRLALAEDPQQKLEQLFAFYVERSFVTREYEEEILNRGMRRLLRTAGVADYYHQERLGNDEYHATFPFVATKDSVPLQVIKPLNLAQADSTRIIEHGGRWILRVSALRKRALLPHDVLFAVNGEENADTKEAKARREIVDELRRLDVQVVPVAQREEILTFATRVEPLVAPDHKLPLDF
jgi:hypothetical protein